MTEEKGFGGRSAEDRRQAWDDYKGEMKAIGKKLTLKQWIIGLLGIYVVIHMLVASNGAGTKASGPAAAPTAQSAQSVPTGKPSCGGVTLKQYGAVSAGMSQREVAAIYGCPGTEMSRVSAGGIESVMVSWPAAGGFGSTDATFDNDHLTGKAQIGLE